MRCLLLLLSCLLAIPLTGCAVPIALSVRSPVLGKNETGIWFQKPSVGDGNMDERAAKHCAEFGKDAVYRATLPMAQGFAVPVVVYDCVDPQAAPKPASAGHNEGVFSDAAFITTAGRQADPSSKSPRVSYTCRAENPYRL